ncbi:MFS transporter [Streptomyces sp. NBC_01264]|uniref:MFS transporter n=1 Tax=Streptomyces sp. NBC_01264 TaxID=2903804 RepID=UPI00225AD0AF|nr:MFS transporter [Streptomyces sp. NBC_01264]MCX4779610.1 MFS transporter [Streptomyces sp. NBC_01264]
MAVVRDLRVLLRLRDFRNLLAVRLLSQAADGVYQVALAAYVVFSPEKQASPAAIASAMAVLLLPYSVVGPFAGVLLDRWRRRQVFLYGNLLRAFLACVTGMLIVAQVPDWLFYASALSVTAVNRFVLAGLAASLPRVVAPGQLVTANALSPTAGTLAAVAGGGLAFLVRLMADESDALVVLLGAGLYLCAALASLHLALDVLGPDHPPGRINPTVVQGIALTVRGLAEGLRHLASRREAARALTAMTVMRFCYGALFVTLLMLCRYAWSDNEAEGLALLGVTVGVSGAGFFAAAVVTPWLVGRLGPLGSITLCAAGAAVLVPALGLFFAPGPMLAAAFVLGLATQGAKISTDTVVQSQMDDAFRGRVFSVYDVLFNAAFVGAAGVAALVLPLDGHSVPLILGVATLYAATAALLMRQGDVSRETSP